MDSIRICVWLGDNNWFDDNLVRVVGDEIRLFFCLSCGWREDR